MAEQAWSPQATQQDRAMTELTYNASKDRYTAFLRDDVKTGWPVYVTVEGPEMAEAVSKGGNLDELCQDVPMWESLIGDNEGVYYTHTPYGEDAFV